MSLGGHGEAALDEITWRPPHGSDRREGLRWSGAGGAGAPFQQKISVQNACTEFTEIYVQMFCTEIFYGRGPPASRWGQSVLETSRRNRRLRRCSPRGIPGIVALGTAPDECPYELSDTSRPGHPRETFART